MKSISVMAMSAMVSLFLNGCNLLAVMEPPRVNLDSICNDIYVENRNNNSNTGGFTANQKYNNDYYTVDFVGYYDEYLGYPAIIKDVKDSKGNVFYKIILMYQNDKLENHKYVKGQEIAVNQINLGMIVDNLFYWHDYKEHYCRFDVLNKLE